MTDPYGRVPGPICRECGRPSLTTIRGLCPDCRRLTRAEERRLVFQQKRKAKVKLSVPLHEFNGYRLCYEHRNCTKAGIDLMKTKAYSQFYRRPKLWLKNLKTFI